MFSAIYIYISWGIDYGWAAKDLGFLVSSIGLVGFTALAGLFSEGSPAKPLGDGREREDILGI